MLYKVYYDAIVEHCTRYLLSPEYNENIIDYIPHGTIETLKELVKYHRADEAKLLDDIHYNRYSKEENDIRLDVLVLVGRTLIKYVVDM